MFIEKYSMFSSPYIRYTVNINKNKGHREKVSKERERISYEEKNCFNHNGSTFWTFSYSMWL